MLSPSQLLPQRLLPLHFAPAVRAMVVATASGGSSGSGDPSKPDIALGFLDEKAVLLSITALLTSLSLACVATRSLTPLPWEVMREVLAGGLAAAIGETVFYPVEVAKVRLQAASRQKTSLLAELWPMLTGGLGMWASAPGVVAGVARALIYHGLRLGLFPPIRRALHVLLGGASVSLLAEMLVGAACGGLGAVLCNPLDLVKARMAAAPSDYPNSLAALGVIAKTEGGAASLWRGAPATTVRAALGSGAQLATYGTAKRWVASSPLIPSGYGMPVLVATCLSAAAYVTAAAPADLIKTRLMLSRAGTGGASCGTDAPVYAGPIDCLRRSVAEEGVLVLFRGWSASFARLLPVLLLVFPLLERIRMAFGVGVF